MPGCSQESAWTFVISDSPSQLAGLVMKAAVLQASPLRGAGLAEEGQCGVVDADQRDAGDRDPDAVAVVGADEIGVEHDDAVDVAEAELGGMVALGDEVEDGGGRRMS